MHPGLKNEWKKYLDETQGHVSALEGVCAAMGIDPKHEIPGRAVVRHLGGALVEAMKLALSAGDRAAAELVACECVVLAETKDHLDWELISKCGEHLTGKAGEALKSAAALIETKRDRLPQSAFVTGREVSFGNAERGGTFFAGVLTADHAGALWCYGPCSTTVAEIRVPTTNARVWVVDDSSLHGEVFRRALVPHYDVTVFSGGAAMLEVLASGGAPDVLLLDWFMPDMSGADVSRFVRERMNSAQLPILVVTAIGTSDDLLEALSAGANDFVHKTVTAPELNARVAGLVRMARLHASLTEAERKLRVEAVFRERFMGMLAHDLRQPLSTVITACDVLLELNPSEKAAGVVQRQLRAAQRMRRMVTDLLDFAGSRPETGMPVQKRWDDLAHIARTSLDEIRAANPQHVLDLSVEGSCQGQWDSDRLAQVLSNLVGNALAHGDPDGPVDVRLTGQEASVELRVSNRGPTIPEDVLSTLFQPFQRVRTARRPSDGVGLGLHIVQQIVHAHGGTLAAHSRDGETHFLVTLPRDARASATSSEPPAGA